MQPDSGERIGYVLKMYPRFSETFIVSELLAHEEAGTDIEIFSLRHAIDGRFHETLARVRAPVTYLPHSGLKAVELWETIATTHHALPGFWTAFEAANGEDVRDVYQALLLARMVRERGITHLHAHFGSLATTVARLAACFARVPYSFTAHAKDLFHESVQPDDLRRKLNNAAAVVTVSDYNVSYLQEHFGPAARRVHRIYNGLDLQHFAYAAPAERPARIVAVGRLIEKKGFGDLVDACAILKRRQRAFRCEIVGAGLLEAELQAQIKALGLADCVEMLGPRPQGEVIALMRAAAVFAAPCVVGEDGNRDGLPTVLLEAMALGTPCVSTDVTGIPEVITDGETGLMVSQNNPAALADAIERLLDHSDLRVHLATNARRLIEDRFDIHRNAAHIRALWAQARQDRVDACVEAN